jgi:hypothetical protein
MTETTPPRRNLELDRQRNGRPFAGSSVRRGRRLGPDAEAVDEQHGAAGFDLVEHGLEGGDVRLKGELDADPLQVAFRDGLGRTGAGDVTTVLEKDSLNEVQQFGPGQRRGISRQQLLVEGELGLHGLDLVLELGAGAGDARVLTEAVAELGDRLVMAPEAVEVRLHRQPVGEREHQAEERERRRSARKAARNHHGEPSSRTMRAPTWKRSAVPSGVRVTGERN